MMSRDDIGIAAIVNPVSGRRSVLPVVREIGEHIKQAGGRFHISMTERAGHASELAAALPEHITALLTVGGDGTVREVAHGLAGRKLPMAILATGTENLLARELNMPTAPIAVAQLLLSGEAFGFDAGLLNNERFLAVAGVGFDAECVHRMTQARSGHITHWSYFWPLWRTFWSHRFPRIVVDVDSERAFDGQGFAFVGVIRNYSTGLDLLQRAEYDDGLLDVLICPCRNRTSLLRRAGQAYLRKLVDDQTVIYRQCKQVHIESPESVPVHIDGDVGGCLPIRCESLPHAITFLRRRRIGHEKLGSRSTTSA